MQHTTTQLDGPYRQTATRIALALAVLVLALAAMSALGLSVATPAAAQEEISDWNDLQNVSQNLSGDYVLTNDLNATTAGYDAIANETANEGQGFLPIGSGVEGGVERVDAGPQQTGGPFIGTFDGQGHEISGLYIDRTTENIGLFGVIESAGLVENVALRDVDITGLGQTGGLFGYNIGIVTQSSATGIVTGTSTDEVSRIGGLGGRNDGLLTESYANVTVKSPGGEIGGLVGQVYEGGTLSDSYALGDVTGSNDVGGLVGIVAPDSDGDLVTRSYAAGTVNGSEYVGGLVGASSRHGGNGTVTDSYWDIGTTNQSVGIGQDNGTSSNVVGYGTVSDSGPAEAMQGVAATTNMAALDFETIWDVRRYNEISYPFLANNSQVPAPGLQTLNASLSDLDVAGQGASAIVAGGSMHQAAVNVTNTGQLNGSFGVTFNVSNASGVQVSATMTTGDLAPGESTTVTIPDVSSMLDIAVAPYNITVTTSNATVAGEMAVRPDVNGDGTPALDLTGDSLLDDINGDNSYNILDIQALFTALGEPVVQDNPSFFDFAGTGSDRVSIFAVQALYAGMPPEIPEEVPVE